MADVKPMGILSAYEPSLRDRIAFGIGGLLGGDNYRQGSTARKIGGLLDFIPGIGDVIGFEDAKRDFDAGNYGQAALGAGASTVGLVPGGGDLAAGGLKALASMISLPLFHGSKAEGLTELAQSTRGALGPGVYATPADNIARRYGDNVYELEDVERDIHQGLGSRYGGSWSQDNARLLAAVEPEHREELEAIIGKMWSGDGYPMRARIAQMYRDEGKAQDLYRRAGFEGIAGHADGPEVVLFDRQKVKR